MSDEDLHEKYRRDTAKNLTEMFSREWEKVKENPEQAEKDIFDLLSNADEFVRSIKPAVVDFHIELHYSEKLNKFLPVVVPVITNDEWKLCGRSYIARDEIHL